MEQDKHDHVGIGMAGFGSRRLWLDRIVVMGHALVAGLLVVGFTAASDLAFAWFRKVYLAQPWAALILTPAVTASVVWCTTRWAPGAGGSGIPQIKAALATQASESSGVSFASLGTAVAKIVLGVGAFASGLSIGREGPSVQIAAGVMQHARRWSSASSEIDSRALLVAGGAAGVAAAFNAPLAGVVFSIEQLCAKLEVRSSGVVIAAIVLAGLVAVAVFGSRSFFGNIQVPQLSWTAIGPGVLVATVAGIGGGVFSRLLIASLAGGGGPVNRLRRLHPVAFAGLCGFAVALIGIATSGVIFGPGSRQVELMLQGEWQAPALYAMLKLVATWLSAWTGAPGGIFSPSLSIGAAVGAAVAPLASSELGPALIALGMASFLAAVTQAPLTAFIIVMEMVEGHSMVLSLMAAAMLASLIARAISRPLYETLAANLIHRLPNSQNGDSAARVAQRLH